MLHVNYSSIILNVGSKKPHEIKKFIIVKKIFLKNFLALPKILKFLNKEKVFLPSKFSRKLLNRII